MKNQNHHKRHFTAEYRCGNIVIHANQDDPTATCDTEGCNALLEQTERIDNPFDVDVRGCPHEQ